MIMKPEKSAFVLPVTTRANKQRQRLNLYGRCIQVAGNLRRRQVMYPNRQSYISFQAILFYKKEKCREGIWNSGKRLIRQKLQSGSFSNILSSIDW